MDPLHPQPNKQFAGKQGSAQMVQQPSGIQNAVIPGPNRRALYFSTQSKGEISAVIKDGGRVSSVLIGLIDWDYPWLGLISLVMEDA